MTLRLSNTLTRRKEFFESLEPGRVGIYCCGVTVYGPCHLGHARSYINWDVLRRYLIWQGLLVTFVQNFTDIDDKILKRAAEENSSMTAVSERNIEAFHQDMDALGILRPDRMPRATQCLDEIRSLIADLEAKGAAYRAEGDVYFAVTKHAGYGRLSGRELSEQQNNAAGRIIGVEEIRKRHPFDFALWKKAKPGEPSFPSVWGEGRPGWHIECSAMVRQELGDTIDIHLGGSDLVFPHHENELAQSEVANGCELARYWLHNGMVNVNGQKMSKSLDNFTTIRALLDSGMPAMALRLFVLQSHYSKPLDITSEALEAANNGWRGLNAALALGEDCLETLNWTGITPLPDVPILQVELPWEDSLEVLKGQFISAMDDDLNTARALAVLFELARPLRVVARSLACDDEPAARLATANLAAGLQQRWELLRQLAGVLGLRHEVVSNNIEDSDSVEIEVLVTARQSARQSHDFAAADRIRDELVARGVELTDRPDGMTDWRRRRGIS